MLRGKEEEERLASFRAGGMAVAAAAMTRNRVKNNSRDTFLTDLEGNNNEGKKV